MNSTDTYLNKRAMGDDRDFLEAMRGQGATEGPVVNHKTALTYNPVWAAVTRISGDVAKLPLNMYLRTGADERELAFEHPTQHVVRRTANYRMAAFRFWRTMMMHVLLYNRAYAWIERDDQMNCVGLFNLPPERCTPYSIGANLDFDRFLVTFEDGQQATVPLDQILDITGIQHDEGNMLDTTCLARQNWGTGMAGESFLSAFFINGSNAGGFLEVPPETQPDSAINLAQAIADKNKGLTNAFKIMVLRDGAKYHQTTIRPVDAQMVELLANNVKDVARWFNLPPSKLGSDDSGVYGSREQDARDYLDSCLAPWLHTIQSQCDLKLTPTYSPYYFEHNTAALLETDTLTKYQVAQIGITTGILNPNEVRRMLNLNPRDDDLGDLYYMSNNMQPMTEEILFPPEPEPVVVEETVEDDEEADADDSTQEAERHLEESIANIRQQMRRRLAKVVKERGAEGAAAYWQRRRTWNRNRLACRISEAATALAILTSASARAIGQLEADTIIDEIDQGTFL